MMRRTRDGAQAVCSQRNSMSSLSSTGSFFQDENAIVDDEEEQQQQQTTSTLISPDLMATSVDNSLGRLLPSLSTISLLSLSKEQMLESPLSPEIRRNTSFRSHARSSFHQQRHPQLYRRSSQQIFQHMQPASASSFSHQHNTASQQQSAQSNNQQSSTPIMVPMMMPGTPAFGPISLANSPSGFYLSQQQLPASLQRTSGFPMIRHNSNASQLVMGNMSPLLDPVGGDAPMTPLMLDL